jgi:hypothetical protein
MFFTLIGAHPFLLTLKGGEASVAINKERLTQLLISMKGGESNGKAA